MKPEEERKARAKERLEARGENRPCENCGNVFLSVPRPGRLGGRSRFCSKDCANSRRSALAEWRKPMKTCNVCHAEKEQDKFLERRLTCNDCLGAAAIAAGWKTGKKFGSKRPQSTSSRRVSRARTRMRGVLPLANLGHAINAVRYFWQRKAIAA